MMAKSLSRASSCRRVGDDYVVATNKWTKLTDTILSRELLQQFAKYCCEFLIHAADVEGLCRGIDSTLVKCKLAEQNLFNLS